MIESCRERVSEVKRSSRLSPIHKREPHSSLHHNESQLRRPSNSPSAHSHSRQCYHYNRLYALVRMVLSVRRWIRSDFGLSVQQRPVSVAGRRWRRFHRRRGGKATKGQIYQQQKEEAQCCKQKDWVRPAIEGIVESRETQKKSKREGGTKRKSFWRESNRCHLFPSSTWHSTKGLYWGGIIFCSHWQLHFIFSILL